MDSAELVDMIAKDASATEVSDALKDMLYAKSADEVEKITPQVAAAIFGDTPENPDESDEIEAEKQPEAPEANAEVETQDQEQQEEE